MIMKLNIFSEKKMQSALCSLSFVLWSLFAAVSAKAETTINRDPTINCAGVPQWDRFVVNTKDTKWDPAASGCYATPSDASVRVSDSVKNAPAAADRAMYGTYDPNADGRGARAMYGTFDGTTKSSVPAAAANSAPDIREALPKDKLVVKPIAAVAPKTQTSPPAAKPIVKSTAKAAAKPVVKPAAKKSAKSAKPAAATVAKPKPAPAPAVPPTPAQTVTESPPPAPKPAAANIARAVVNNPDNYCGAVSKPVMGKLPPGFVLMPGSPDSMCCTAK